MDKITMKPKNLDEQFKYSKSVPKERYQGSNQHLLISSLRMVNIIRYIVKNKCVLETIESIDSDDWKVSTLRKFLDFATGTIYKEPPEETGFQDYLKWWRIKTAPTEQEIYDACHVK